MKTQLIFDIEEIDCINNKMTKLTSRKKKTRVFASFLLVSFSYRWSVTDLFFNLFLDRETFVFWLYSENNLGDYQVRAPTGQFGHISAEVRSARLFPLFGFRFLKKCDWRWSEHVFVSNFVYWSSGRMSRDIWPENGLHSQGQMLKINNVRCSINKILSI